MSDTAKIPRRRNAADLFVRGSELVVRGEGDEEVLIWVRKLDDLDMKAASRRANAARAKMKAALRDKDGDDWLDLITETERQFTRDGAIDFMVLVEIAPREAVISAQVAGAEDSEWVKDDYLTGLLDQWQNELKSRFAVDAEDPEARHVLDEINRFNAAVEEQVERERSQMKAQFEGLSDDALQEKLMDVIVEAKLAAVFVDHHNACKVWLASRHAHDHEKYHFDSLEAVQRADRRVRDQILTFYRFLEVEPLEGKDLPGSPASSTSSDSPETVEDSEPSSPLVATG